ncbi:hypothetical protein MmiHf6_01970 [Methanimicrococcus hongohii]|uniref:Uncharacterized protein n=1 Tax=Methanimicrococcus hongohii TaxID=3028295 RepID=A0AA96V069_9EURY|nr:hypothetical protein [Methanimicrococcus sp. Hf6]WNY22905.1 hypothetical protein MmiHf6_01970 [Methanimicrococcus sp. Hf6]
MIDKKDEERTVNKECVFKKILTESKITGLLTVDTDHDNESAVIIDGDRMISSIIPGIRHIHLQRDEGIIRDYIFLVFGKCPDEFDEMEVSFKDSEEKVRKVRIVAKEEKWHSERYSSKKPDITEITWDYKKLNL